MKPKKNKAQMTSAYQKAVKAKKTKYDKFTSFQRRQPFSECGRRSDTAAHRTLAFCRVFAAQGFLLLGKLSDTHERITDLLVRHCGYGACEFIRLEPHSGVLANAY